MRLAIFLLHVTLFHAANLPMTSANGNIIALDSFNANSANMTCESWNNDNKKWDYGSIRGVNLGGWLVLEPWITPSLFYQFIGGNPNTTAMDISSFCRILGPEEGNKQLRRHWKTWVTEEIIRELAEEGGINSIRLPVGEWMYNQYEPYIGCTDGALDYVDKLLDWCEKYGISVLFDIHAVQGSQNGFDNSGSSGYVEWIDNGHTDNSKWSFVHWSVAKAEWIGTFDHETLKYTSINEDHIKHTLRAIEVMVEKYKYHPAVLGLEPLNEPWWWTPMDRLKRFYWDGYLIVKKNAKHWKYIMHDSFRFGVKEWGGFMAGCPDRAIDTHIYNAWNDPTNKEGYFNMACADKTRIAKMEKEFGPVVVGEWSLATDNCAMWLNGFNDNMLGFPKRPCKYVECPLPYMGGDQPFLDPGKPYQGPYGTGTSGPAYGMCPVDRDWIKDVTPLSPNNVWLTSPASAPHGLDDTANVMTALALKKINSFSLHGHGFYFWNFRTELDETQWNYLEAVRQGWIPTGADLHSQNVLEACKHEDAGDYQCTCKPGMSTKSIREACQWALEQDGYDHDYLLSMDGDELRDEATRIFQRYWYKHRIEGATCDFGGLAIMLPKKEATSFLPVVSSFMAPIVIIPTFFVLIFVALYFRHKYKVVYSSYSKLGSFASLGNLVAEEQKKKSVR